MASIFNTIARGAATLGGSAYDYLTPGKGQSRVTEWGAQQPRPPAPAPSPNFGGSGYGSAAAAPAPDLSAIYNQAYAAALAKSQVPVPRLVTMDSGAAWSKASQMATAAVSPIYQQKMTDFLNAQKVALQRQQEDTTSGKAAADLALSRNLADTQVQRQRSTQDTATNINDINATQDYTARTQGLSFDAAQRALTEGVGAAGTGESGIGQGQVSEAAKSYGLQSNEQVRQSTDKVAAANELMNRTFTDLGTSDTRNTEDTNTKKASLDLNLERFIQDQGTNLDQEQKQEELQKQADIAQQTITDKGQLVDQWLASLSGKGYTAQEIANAAAIYK